MVLSPPILLRKGARACVFLLPPQAVVDAGCGEPLSVCRGSMDALGCLSLALLLHQASKCKMLVFPSLVEGKEPMGGSGWLWWLSGEREQGWHMQDQQLQVQMQLYRHEVYSKEVGQTRVKDGQHNPVLALSVVPLC